MTKATARGEVVGLQATTSCSPFIAKSYFLSQALITNDAGGKLKNNIQHVSPTAWRQRSLLNSATTKELTVQCDEVEDIS